jgi:FixJ family two-component response regulator
LDTYQLCGEPNLESLPRTVAVVEDDPSMRRSIERLLNAHGYQTEGYASAETFLGRDSANPIGCLVLDIHLGNMSGIQLRRQLRDSGFSLPVIFVTAVDDDALEAEARDAGCLAYLHKPFAANLLLSAIHDAMPGPSAAEDGMPAT